MTLALEYSLRMDDDVVKENHCAPPRPGMFCGSLLFPCAECLSVE